MKGHPETSQASTQLGFARLVDCSLGLIRAVELGTKISPKLAKKVQAVTGVSISWLSKKQDPNQPIPAAGGGILTHETVIARFQQEAECYLQEAERESLISFNASADLSEAAKDPGTSMKRRMASTMAKLVEDALYESLNRGDQRLINEITRALSREFPGEESKSETP